MCGLLHTAARTLDNGRLELGFFTQNHVLECARINRGFTCAQKDKSDAKCLVNCVTNRGFLGCIVQWGYLLYEEKIRVSSMLQLLIIE